MTAANGTNTVRVMLVEDNAALRRLVASLVDRQPDLEVVAQAGSLEEARRSAASVGCDVAVLDLGLPDGSGADLIEELRELCPGYAALVFSASLAPKTLAGVREAGAEGVLDKFATPAEVLEAIRRLGHG
ncbi:MAG TPA: response regulator transcription factor [Rubrobacter sp.]|nr:response regulator transcription factor [Rubrobacter sp.]